MKKFWLIAVSVLFLLMIGVAVYVSFIDWNQHKAKIAASLYDMTGKKVSFDGDVSVSLFPTPTMTAQNVSVFNPDGAYAQKPLATIKNLVAKVSLSSLLGGDFDVSRVSAQEPEIFLEIGEKGAINWRSDFKQSQEDEIRDMNISLDSVTLENAKLHFIYPQMEIDTILSNLNAEIIAENVFGPYRIEGSYTKGENPEGFAISIGQLGENISTSINMAVNYPTSQSYIRYDGTVYFRENKVLGSVAVESEKPADFLADIFDIPTVNPAYNQKFALTAAINTDISKVELSGVALQYGKTAGAGNVLIPLPDKGKYHPKVEMAFNMTDLDLDTPALYLKNLLNGYESKSYQPWNLKFDLIGDVKALKSYYKNDSLKNFELSFDLVNNKLLLRQLKAAAAGNTQFGLRGNLAEENGGFKYNGEASFKTEDLVKISQWLAEIELKPVVEATFRNFDANLSFSGDLKLLSVPNYRLKMDDFQVSGSAGMALVANFDKLLVANVDMLNFDNYLPQLPKLEAEKNLDKRLTYVFKQLEPLKNLNLTLSLDIGQGVLFHTAFENLKLEAVLEKDKLNISQFGINNYLNSDLVLQGGVAGFGDLPKFENLQYNLDTANMGKLLSEIGVSVPFVNWNNVKDFSSQGVIAGDVENLSVRTETSWDKNNIDYTGYIDFRPEKIAYNGKVVLKSPDFLKMLKTVDVQYSPRAFALGNFDFKANLLGDVSKFKLSDLSVGLGTNKFDGFAEFDNSSGRPSLFLKGNFNLLEVEKFLPENSANVQSSFVNNVGNAEFLAKNNWSSSKFDFSVLNKLDVAADVQADQLVYANQKFLNVKTKFDLKNSNLNVQNFDAGFSDGKVSFSAVLDNAVTPILRGKAKLDKVLFMNFGGKKYALRQAIVSGDVDFNSELSSDFDFVSKLDMTADLKAENVDISGWNLSAVKLELQKVNSIEGLTENLSKLLQNGGTMFSSFSGKFIASKGDYKLEKAVLKSPDIDINLQAQGNIVNWTLNMLLDVSWADKNIFPFAFNYTGGLDNPVLGLDVSKVITYFNDRNAKLRAEQKAAEDAKYADLSQKLNEQFENSQQLKTQYVDVFLPLCSRLLEVVRSDYLKNKISDIQSRADKAVNSIDEALALKLAPLPTQDNLQKVTFINQREKVYLDENLPMLQKWMSENVNQRLNDAKNEALKNFTAFSSAMNAFDVDFQKFQPRLIVAQSKLNLDENPKIGDLKKQMQNLFAEVSEKQSKVLADTNLSNEVQNIDALEKNIEAFSAQADYLNAQIVPFRENIQTILDLAEALVAHEEKLFDQQKEALARAEKIKAETGTIANDSTGEVKTIMPSSAGEAKTDDDGAVIRVLDFSKGDVIPINKKPLKPSYNGVVIRE